MTRHIAIALAVCAAVICGALLLGRALDQQLRASLCYEDGSCLVPSGQVYDPDTGMLRNPIGENR